MGRGRHAGRGHHRRPARVARTQRRTLALVRPAAPAAHQRGDFRVRRLRAVRDVLLCGPAHLPRAPVQHGARVLYVLGLAGGDRAGRDHAAARLHQRQGIRRARMADRYPDHAGVGVLRGGFFRNPGDPPHQAYLCRELVFRRLHPDGCAAASRQQRGNSGDDVEIVFRLRRRAGRDGAVVVRPQRRGLFPDRGFPRHHVLLYPEAGRAARVLGTGCRSCTSGR